VHVKAEAQCLRPGGNNPLRGEENRRHLAQASPQRPRRRPQEKWAAQAARHGLLKLGMAQRLRGHGVHGTVPTLVVDGADNHAHEVAARDPGHPLSTTPEHRPEAQPCGKRHHRQRSPLPVEDESDAQADHANTQRARLAGFSFPVPAQGGCKVAAGGCLLVKDDVSGVAKVPDGGTAHQDARPHLERAEPGHKARRELNARAAD